MNARMLFGIFALASAQYGLATAKDPEDWVFRGARMDEIPAPGERPCRATRHGATVNTRLFRNRGDQMVVAASWPTWDHTEYPVSASLSVDGGPAVQVTGYSIGPLFMVRIEDQQLHQAIRAASTLTWHLPWGDFTADVEGLGAAFDAIDVCPG